MAVSVTLAHHLRLVQTNEDVEETSPGSGLFYDADGVLIFVEDPLGSDLYESVNTDNPLVEDPPGSGLYRF